MVRFQIPPFTSFGLEKYYQLRGVDLYWPKIILRWHLWHIGQIFIYQMFITKSLVNAKLLVVHKLLTDGKLLVVSKDLVNINLFSVGKHLVDTKYLASIKMLTDLTVDWLFYCTLITDTRKKHSSRMHTAHSPAVDASEALHQMSVWGSWS